MRAEEAEDKKEEEERKPYRQERVRICHTPSLSLSPLIDNITTTGINNDIRVATERTGTRFGRFLDAACEGIGRFFMIPLIGARQGLSLWLFKTNTSYGLSHSDAAAEGFAIISN